MRRDNHEIPRPLVVSHSGEATGAAIALLRVMRWCVDKRCLEPIFVLRSEGALVDQFRELGPTFVHSRDRQRGAEHQLRRVPGGSAGTRALASLAALRLRQLCQRHKANLVYLNTAIDGRVLSGSAPLELPLVAHVHELERDLGAVGLDDVRALIGRSDRLFGVSRAVKRMLALNGAHEDQIALVQEPVDPPPTLPPDERARLRREFLGVDGSAIVVVACGHPGWRKGTDVFLRVAQAALASKGADRRIAFRWIGGRRPNDWLTTLDADVAQLGMDGSVRAIEQLPDAHRVLAAVDIFISTSREDANPLVVLEAAAAARPVVCFRGAGGAEELADLGAAIAVPYLDADVMAHAVVELAVSEEKRNRLGAAARAAVVARNETGAVARQVAGELASLVRSPTQRRRQGRSGNAYR